MATSASSGPVMATMGAEGSLDSMDVRAIDPVSRSVPPTMTRAMALLMPWISSLMHHSTTNCPAGARRPAGRATVVGMQDVGGMG